MTVPYPNNRSEVEIQVELWWKIKIRYSIDVRLGVAIPASGKNGNTAILDIAIFKHYEDSAPELVCIVECKRGTAIPNNSQINKYKQFGVPVLIANATNIDWTVEKVGEFCSGRPWNYELLPPNNSRDDIPAKSMRERRLGCLSDC